MTTTISSEMTIERTHPLAGALNIQVIAAATFPDWYERGRQIVDMRPVVAASTTDTGVFALVSSQAADAEHAYSVQLDVRDDGTLEGCCDCPISERHALAWCKHRVALALIVYSTACGDRPVYDAESSPGWAVIGAGSFATFDKAANLPVASTWVTPGGSRRHIGTWGGRYPKPARCGQLLDGDRRRGTRDMPLCVRCAEHYRNEPRTAKG